VLAVNGFVTISFVLLSAFLMLTHCRCGQYSYIPDLRVFAMQFCCNGGVWTNKVADIRSVHCILASCYIRLTLNICSFVHQCNTFTSYFLLIVDMFRQHGGHKDNTNILTNGH
jgi:hypothetical protein